MKPFQPTSTPYLLSAITALLLIGCGTPKTWQQAGKTEAQMHKDLADCKVRASQISNPMRYMPNLAAQLTASGREDDFLKDCMMGKGWTWQQSAPASSAPPIPATH